MKNDCPLHYARGKVKMLSVEYRSGLKPEEITKRLKEYFRTLISRMNVPSPETKLKPAVSQEYSGFR